MLEHSIDVPERQTKLTIEGRSEVNDDSNNTLIKTFQENLLMSLFCMSIHYI